MARPRHLYVFAYDVASNGDRRRLAERLEDSLVRVQKSVFEGRLTKAEADRLARETAPFLDEGDSLRVYCVTEEARENSLAIGGAPLAEAGDFWIA